MAFEGWFFKVNGMVFPNRLIALSSYKVTPNQIMDLDPYRDAYGELHRNVVPHKATSLEFSTPHLYDTDAEILNTFLPPDNRVRCEIEYWNPNTSMYEAGAFYIADIPYEIENVDEERKQILYKPIKVTFTEY